MRIIVLKCGGVSGLGVDESVRDEISDAIFKTIAIE